MPNGAQWGGGPSGANHRSTPYHPSPKASIPLRPRRMLRKCRFMLAAVVVLVAVSSMWGTDAACTLDCTSAGAGFCTCTYTVASGGSRNNYYTVMSTTDGATYTWAEANRLVRGILPGPPRPRHPAPPGSLCVIPQRRAKCLPILFLHHYSQSRAAAHRRLTPGCPCPALQLTCLRTYPARSQCYQRLPVIDGVYWNLAVLVQGGKSWENNPRSRSA